MAQRCRWHRALRQGGTVNAVDPINNRLLEVHGIAPREMSYADAKLRLCLCDAGMTQMGCAVAGISEVPILQELVYQRLILNSALLLLNFRKNSVTM